MSNIIFFFSGTGNCLQAAKTAAKELGDCEIIPMGRPGKYSLTKQYDSIGFIYPTYFWGLPKIVIEFVTNIDLGNNKNSYYYSIVSNGGEPGNSVYQLYELLQKKHGVKLNYGREIKSFSNYIILHDIVKNTEELLNESNKKLFSIIEEIKSKKNNKVSSLAKLSSIVNKVFVKTVSEKDKNYNVSSECNGCGICKKVCPVNNIELKNNKPEFNHKCEQCLACVHYCPKKAINYKNKTQNMARYTNPEISYTELAEYNKKV